MNHGTHLLFAHPVVHLLRVPVEELQVHALLILLPAQLPQFQQRLLLLRQDAQLHTHTHTHMSYINPVAFLHGADEHRAPTCMEERMGRERKALSVSQDSF